MTKPNIPYQRLHNQHLLRAKLKKPEDVVRWLGAVQAQDYHGAKWALALRLDGITNVELDQAFDEGKILRTHVMRPTWHFVLPEDILWMLQLTAPRVSILMSYYNRRLELDDSVFKRSNEVLARALQGGKQLTRKELAAELKKSGILADTQRLGHLVMQAELDGFICSGPLRGKQFTYALLKERAPNAKQLTHHDALAELAKRYFQSHGPATVHDFAWWSGLTIADAKLGVELARPKLDSETIQQKTYWFSSLASHQDLTDTIHLLPNYDEYLISYKDYSPIFSGEVKALANPFGNALLAHIIVRNGLVIGGWKRLIEKSHVIIKTDLLVKLTKTEQIALQHEVERYGTFMNLPVTHLQN